MALTIHPISLKDANNYVELNHRHHHKTQGHKFSIACYDDDRLCGVAIVGRPLSRHLDDGKTLEILRCCTDGTHNACSILYGRAARIAKLMGYERIITYILESESGSSLLASGYTLTNAECGGVIGVANQDRERSSKSLCSERSKNILFARKRDMRGI